MNGISKNRPHPNPKILSIPVKRLSPAEATP